MAIPVDLRRLQSSRKPRWRLAEAVGEVLGRVVMPYVMRTADRRAIIEAVVADVLPPALAAGIAVGRVRHGKLVIYTQDSPGAWVLRVQWRGALLEALRQHVRTMGVREIEVRIGIERNLGRGVTPE